MVIESAGIPGQFVCKRRKQEIYEFRIVENAMNIGHHAGGVHAVTVGRAVLPKIQGRIGSTFHEMCIRDSHGRGVQLYRQASGSRCRLRRVFETAGWDGRGKLAEYLYHNYPNLKIGWYSGRDKLSEEIKLDFFHYIKLGPYISLSLIHIFCITKAKSKLADTQPLHCVGKMKRCQQVM